MYSTANKTTYLKDVFLPNFKLLKFIIALKVLLIGRLHPDLTAALYLVNLTNLTARAHMVPKAQTQT